MAALALPASLALCFVKAEHGASQGRTGPRRFGGRGSTVRKKSGNASFASVHELGFALQDWL